MITESPVVLVGPETGYGHGGRLFAEMLGRERELREVGIADVDGNTEAPAALQERISAAIHELGADGRTPALVGYSLGAVAAVEFAAANPGVASSLVLAAPWARATPKMRALASLWASLHTTGEPLRRREDALLAARIALVSARGWNAAPSSAGVRLAPVVGADIGALMECCGLVDLEADASLILDPTLVIVGTRDEFAEPEQGHLLFGAIGTARLAEIDTGHAMLLERPSETLDLVESFIAEPARFPAGSRIPRRQP